MKRITLMFLMAMCILSASASSSYKVDCWYDVSQYTSNYNIVRYYLTPYTASFTVALLSKRDFYFSIDGKQYDEFVYMMHVKDNTSKEISEYLDSFIDKNFRDKPDHSVFFIDNYMYDVRNRSVGDGWIKFRRSPWEYDRLELSPYAPGFRYVELFVNENEPHVLATNDGREICNYPLTTQMKDSIIRFLHVHSGSETMTKKLSPIIASITGKQLALNGQMLDPLVEKQKKLKTSSVAGTTANVRKEVESTSTASRAHRSASNTVTTTSNTPSSLSSRAAETTSSGSFGSSTANEEKKDSSGGGGAGWLIGLVVLYLLFKGSKKSNNGSRSNSNKSREMYEYDEWQKQSQGGWR